MSTGMMVINGMDMVTFNSVVAHTLSSQQLTVGDDCRITHGISMVRDAIFASEKPALGFSWADNDFMMAFDLLIAEWSWKVMEAKGLDPVVMKMLNNLIS